MIIDEKDMNNKILVVLADTLDKAIAYGNKVRPSSLYDIMPMHKRSELYLLYGHRKMPFVVIPGTIVQPWHRELDRHIEWERIIPVGKYRTIKVG